jgi:ADP-heptose:LPS heptosyltransferase
MPDIEIAIRLNAMGDILLTVPTLRAIAARGVEPHLVIGQKWQALAEFLPAVVHVYNGTGSLIRLAAELKKLSPKAVFDLQGKLSSIALRNLVSAPISRAYQKRSLSEQLMTVRGKYPLRFSDQRPVWQKYAATCGVEANADDASLNLSDAYLAECHSMLAASEINPENFIAIHPDASKPGKEIPDELLGEIFKRCPAQIVTIGTGSKKLPGSSIDMRNRFDLRLLPGILHHAKAVISSDSGPMHLARAVNTPVIALFFQTSPSLGFAPIPSENAVIISRDLPRKPCSLHGQNENCPENHFACRQLPVNETVDQILDFLGRFS